MDTTNIDQASDNAMAEGIRVLNAFLLAEDEDGHAQRLLELMDPPQDAVVLDAGCGLGELAKLMHRQRPDLTFKLLNVSAHQLAQCPTGMDRIKADFCTTGLPSESVDVVMFAFSLCHAPDWWEALREARRVLKEGGTLFVYDMVRNNNDDAALMWHLVKAAPLRPATINQLAQAAGFVLDEGLMHQPVRERLREVFSSQALYDVAFRAVIPATMRFTRKTIADPIESAFARHMRIGFQFSGGRDSIAALFKLRRYWSQMTVYHLDTLDQFPELREVVARIEELVHVVRIESNVHALRDSNGLPSDVVPVDNYGVGRLVSGRQVKIVSRYDCCYSALMRPLHDRMRADGITLIIRGQRDDEYDNPPHRSGDVAEGFEVLYPIQSWTAGQVDEYIAANALPVAPFYARGMKRAPECMHCTAWWDEGRAAYLREFHPATHEVVEGRMRTIRIEIERQLTNLSK